MMKVQDNNTIIATCTSYHDIVGMNTTIKILCYKIHTFTVLTCDNIKSDNIRVLPAV